MIRYLPIIAATTIGALATGLVVFEIQKRKHRGELAAEQKKFDDALEKSKQDANEKKKPVTKPSKSTPVDTETVSANTLAQNPNYTPLELLDLLLELDPEEDYSKRRAVHYFETMVDIGPGAVADIRDFFTKDEDLVFKQDPEPRNRNRWNRRGGSERQKQMQQEIRDSSAIDYFQPFPKPSSGFPPTMRLGLLEATTKIGSQEAEQLLIDVLHETGRGVEVAYLDLALEEIAPGVFREDVLKETRSILANPLPESNATKLDERSKGYLYAILVKYKDEVFVEDAKRILISEDGKLDGYALSYLRQVLGERAMPIFLQAYSDSRITNQWEKAAISDAAMHYVGRNTQADEIWREMMKDGFKNMEGESMFSEKRYEKLFLPVMSLARDVDEQEVDTIKARRKLLGDARKGSSDILMQFGLTMLDRRMGEVQKKKEEEKEE